MRSPSARLLRTYTLTRCSTRWWDFGGDAYVVRPRAPNYERICVLNLRCGCIEYKQAHSSHARETLTNGASHVPWMVTGTDGVVGLAVVARAAHRRKLRP